MRLETRSVSVRFLRFRRRVREGVVHLPLVSPTAYLAGGVLDGFRLSLERRYTAYRLDDIEDLIRVFLEGNPNLLGWYGTALNAAGIRFDFSDGAPVISQPCFAQWRDLSLQLDADGLITYAFVKRYRRLPHPSELSDWQTIATTDDHFLGRLFERGVGDIHTHLEGCSCAQLEWQTVRDYPYALGRFREFSEDRRKQLEDHYDAFRDFLQAEEDIIAARRAWQRLERAFDRGRPPDRPSANERVYITKGGARSRRRRIDVERQVLAFAWLILFDDAQFRQEETAAVARALDSYLHGKQRFLDKHVQGPGHNPGLKNFRRFFSRSRPWLPDLSPRLHWERHMRLVRFACESRHLRQLELRISPFDSVPGYRRFFGQWEGFLNRTAASDWPHNRRPPQISFIIHFIRRENEMRRDDATIQFETLRRSLDRETAVLHRFRLEAPELARSIVAIDVANLERNAPIHLFAPYFRLLRGDEEAIRAIKNLYGEHQKYDRSVIHEELAFHRRWFDLCAEGGTYVPASARPLGLTVHAGEDFFHPLDGIRSVADAVSTCAMREGDRIGHGLALGIDVKDFTTRYGGSLVIPGGEALDGLVWLHLQLSRMNGVDPEKKLRLAQEIEKLGTEIYDEPVRIHDLESLMNIRGGFVGFLRMRERRARFELLWEKELVDISCRQRRWKIRQIPEIFLEIVDEIRHVQSAVIRHLAKRNVYIEANPSSNLATGGFDRMAEHPLFHMKSVDEGIKVTVNCDDPGTFAARIENEYALLKEAMRERDMSADAIERLLTDLWEAGRKAAFARDRADDESRGGGDPWFRRRYFAGRRRGGGGRTGQGAGTSA